MRKYYLDDVHYIFTLKSCGRLASIGARTSTQLSIKLPIGYNETPQPLPKKLPLLLQRSPPKSNTPIQSLTPPTIPTASGSTQPFCHNTECRQADRHSGRWYRANVSSHKSHTLAVLIESTAANNERQLLLWNLTLPLFLLARGPHLIYQCLSQPHSLPKWHPDSIIRFSAIHPLDRPTDGQMDQQTG